CRGFITLHQIELQNTANQHEVHAAAEPPPVNLGGGMMHGNRGDGPCVEPHGTSSLDGRPGWVGWRDSVAEDSQPAKLGGKSIILRPASAEAERKRAPSVYQSVQPASSSLAMHDF